VENMTNEEFLKLNDIDKINYINSELKNGKFVNLFAPKDMKKDYLSELGYGALMGILKNYEVMNPFISSTDDALNRIRTILFSSQVKLGSGVFMPVNCNTIHFDTKNPNIVHLLKKANEIITPTPFNYNKAELSGWV
jgi:hypothetical protein